MRTCAPNFPLTQTTVPSRAVTCWAAGSAATVVAADAVAGRARTQRMRIDRMGMGAVSALRGRPRGPQGVRSAHLPAAGAIHAAAVALGRAPGAGRDLRRRGEAAFLGGALAGCAARLGLLVEQLRLARRAAPLGQALDDHRQPRAPERDLQLVARPHVAAGLDRLAVDVHPPAL